MGAEVGVGARVTGQNSNSNIITHNIRKHIKFNTNVNIIAMGVAVAVALLQLVRWVLSELALRSDSSCEEKLYCCLLVVSYSGEKQSTIHKSMLYNNGILPVDAQTHRSSRASERSGGQAARPPSSRAAERWPKAGPDAFVLLCLLFTCVFYCFVLFICEQLL